MKHSKQSFFTFTGRKIYMALIVMIFFMACNSEDKKANQPENNVDTPITKMASQLTGYLYELTMAKAEYKRLRDAHPNPNDKMVFQFYFADTVSNGPTLIAYSATKFGPGNNFGTQANPNAARVLTILKMTGTASLNLDADPVNRKFVLGDQEIRFKKIEDDLGIGVGPGSADFVLRFIPDITGMNIFYKICLVGAACPQPTPPTQPSPPANTD